MGGDQLENNRLDFSRRLDEKRRRGIWTEAREVHEKILVLDVRGLTIL